MYRTFGSILGTFAYAGCTQCLILGRLGNGKLDEDGERWGETTERDDVSYCG